jgi:hypothetical protein
VSNPSAPLPFGIRHVPGFVSPEAEREIEADIDEDDFWKEGFDVQRRVQRFRLSKSAGSGSDDDEEGDEKAHAAAAPASLRRLSERLAEETGLSARYACVEDIPILRSKGQTRKGDYASNHIVTTFESRRRRCPAGCRRCFVACVPVGKTAVQHLNRPARRSASCWSLESRDHWFDVRMDRGSMLVRTGDCLHNWRTSFVDAFDSSCNSGNSFSTNDTVRIIKFYSLLERSEEENCEDNDEAFGYIPKPSDMLRCTQPMPPLHDLLTIIVTTSPVKSNPSTELLERAMDTFMHGGPDFAYKCRKVIVCGTCR